MSFAGYKLGISGYLYIVGLLIAFHYTETVRNVASGQTSVWANFGADFQVLGPVNVHKGTTSSFLVIVETLIDITGFVEYNIQAGGHHASEVEAWLSEYQPRFVEHYRRCHIDSFVDFVGFIC